METNTRLVNELEKKATALIAAAEEYWQEYQKALHPNAVVWLKADNGQFVLFTRGEYLTRIMEVVDYVNASEPPLEHLFAS